MSAAEILKGAVAGLRAAEAVYKRVVKEVLKPGVIVRWGPNEKLMNTCEVLTTSFEADKVEVMVVEGPDSHGESNSRSRRWVHVDEINEVVEEGRG